MTRVRKALGAAVAAALAIVGTKVQQTGLPDSRDGWLGLLGAALAAGLVTGVGVYNLRNEGTINGSDPR